MTCAECDSLLVEHAYGELAPGAAREVEEHLAGCERCSRALADIRLTLTAVRALPEEKPSDAGVPELLAFARDVARAAGERGRSERPPRSGLLPEWLDHLLFRPGWALASAAVIVGLFSLAVLRSGGQKRVEESQLPIAAAPALTVPAKVQPAPEPPAPPAEAQKQVAAPAPKREQVADELHAKKAFGQDRGTLGALGDDRDSLAGAGVGGGAKDGKLARLDAAPAGKEDGKKSAGGLGMAEEEGMRQGAPASAPPPQVVAAREEKARAELPRPETDHERSLYEPSAPAAGAMPVAPAPLRKEKASEENEAAARATNQAAEVGSAVSDAEELFSQAESEQQKDRLDHAYSLFLSLADRYPRDAHAPEALLAAAKIDERRGRTSARDGLLARLAASYPSSPAARSLKR